MQSRVMWLTVARMIVRYQKLKQLVKEPSHIEIIEENEEFWRHKFYSLLVRNSDALSCGYFSSPKDKRGGNKIDKKSIAVIFEFTTWKGEDPLDSIDDVQLFADKIRLHDQFGLTEYLKEDGYWDKVLSAKESK